VISPSLLVITLILIRKIEQLKEKSVVNEQQSSALVLFHPEALKPVNDALMPGGWRLQRAARQGRWLAQIITDVCGVRGGQSG
jgi:hypothetical protein